MAEYQIPISYVVSASTVTPGRGLEPLKLSTILLLTDEAPANTLTDSYMIARTAAAVGQQWGTETETTLQAQTIFSQQPNILANDGYIIIAPYQQTDAVTVPASAGTFTTPDLTNSIDNFKTVTAGVLNITVDGTAKKLTGFDFSGVNTLEDIASVISAKVTNATITVNNGELVFTSNTTGASSNVSIAAYGTVPSGSVDISTTDYLSIDTGVAVAGQDEHVIPSAPETLSQAITRMAGEIYFEGIITTRALTDVEAIAASNLVQSMNNRIFFLPSSDAASLDTNGLFTKVNSNTKTKCLLYTLGETTTAAALNSRLFAAAYASRGFAVNYNGSNTTITMNLKDLTGIQADTNISETILNKCQALGVDCFPSIEGLAKVISNRQGGMYFDQVANQIWFVNSIQRAVFNTLAQTQTKIPQTDAGIEKLISAIRGVCNQAVTNGFIAPGTWNSPDTFGNYEDFYRNIEEFGYYIYAQPVAEQLQAEREERKAPLIQVAAKEAGAVHLANILVYVEA